MELPSRDYIPTEVRTIHYLAEQRKISIDDAVKIFYNQYARQYESMWRQYDGKPEEFPRYFYENVIDK